MKTPMEQIIEHYGSKTNISKELGVIPQAVSIWGDYFPPRQALRLEKKTYKKFKAINLVDPKILE